MTILFIDGFENVHDMRHTRNPLKEHELVTHSWLMGFTRFLMIFSCDVATAKSIVTEQELPDGVVLQWFTPDS